MTEIWELGRTFEWIIVKPGKQTLFYATIHVQQFTHFQVNVGVCYYRGQGIGQSNSKAWKLFLMAAAQGHDDGIKYLKIMNQKSKIKNQRRRSCRKVIHYC